MKKIIIPLITANLVAGCCMAQIYIAPIIGYQVDLNNMGNFKQINSGVQFSLKIKKTKRYEFILELQKNWPFRFNSTDSSFSSNPALPPYSNAKKTIRPSSYSFTIGHRVSLIGIRTRNIFSFVFYGGLNYQKIAVSYQYDKSDYIILNPDQPINRLGLFLCGGVEYMRLLENGRIFIKINAATPPLTKKIIYPSSFGLIAPLSFNAGYSIPIKRNKHGKK